MTGNVSFAGASPVEPIQQITEGLQSASPEEAARGYLSECGSLFGLTDQANDLVMNRERVTEDGRTVVRFQQYFQGVPVFGGELLMQLGAGNNVILVNGSVLPRVKLNTQAGVDPAAAQQAALQLVAEQYGLSADALKVSDAQLWVYSPLLIESKIAPAALVWRMEVTPLELAPIRELVLINAHDGSVVLDINQVDTALNRLTYTAGNTTTRPGTLVCNESDPTCAAGDTDAKNAHKFGGDTYNFYSTYHGRDSLDNAGMSLISTVHYDTAYCNAFWDGFQMTYGDGCTIVVDDVVAHEMTHGVTEYESNLVYSYQSGAINESFSDIWGEFVDLTTTTGGTDTAGNRWLMGEDTSIGAIRDMQDPTTFGDPDRMGSPLYYTGSGDNGGVHTNSGVGNKTAYLITDGDTFNGYTVTGIGITKAAKIFYEAQTNILVSNSNYHSLYDALRQACTTLTGTSGITAADCTEVGEAVLATQLNLLPLPPAAPANDAFASPIVISTTPYTNTQDISSATTAGDDPTFSCTSHKGTTSVWYQVTPSSSGTLTVDTVGSNFDTVLGIWTGSTPAGLTSVGCNDDIDYAGGNYQSRVIVSVTAGQTYRIEAAGYSGGGNLTIHASLPVSSNTPTIIAPKGATTDTTPTYKWSKVTGATNYRYQLMKGATTVYTKTVSASVCGATTCSSTPPNVLGPFAYKWRIQAMVGGVWRAYSAYTAFTISPATIAPKGTITDTTPTYKWTKIAGATQYRYQLVKGATTIYTKTVPASACVGATCTNTPTNVLGAFTYKWRVQAMVGGVWGTYSTYATFTINSSTGGFDSQFTSDAAGWTPSSGSWSVSGGNYHSPGIASKAVTTVHSNSYSTLTYEARMMRTGACISCVNSLYFRGIPNPLMSNNNWNTAFRFSYTNDGYWQFLYINNGVYYSLVDFTPTSAIAQNGWNTLKIVANGTSIKLYINGSMMVSGTATGFNPTGNVGAGFYSSYGASEIGYVDWAKLNLTGLPFEFTPEEEGALTFDLSNETLLPMEGDPNIAP
ncbi:MAG: M4 family metallopeptidase [Chloroflexi bacterium]|nr:M4 family metallopeptidase [Chloroflexota bacterium]